VTRKADLAAKLLRVLVDGQVEFFVVGGVAARAHGLRKQVNDLDVVYRRSRENFRRIVDALRPLNPYPRGLPPGMDVPWNASVIRDGYSFVMVTALGDLDLIAELSGGGTWLALHCRTTRMDVLGVECLCLNTAPLIHHITESGREKDLKLARRLMTLEQRVRKASGR